MSISLSKMAVICDIVSRRYNEISYYEKNATNVPVSAGI
jgi:hypothetical protein